MLYDEANIDEVFENISLAIIELKSFYKKPTNVVGFMWYLQESNQGHMDFQSIALPTELRYNGMQI